MSKITLNTIGSIQTNPTSAATTINDNNDTIEAAFDNTLSLDGTSPNKMGAALDMNSHQLLNLPTPATATSPLRLQDLTSFIAGGTVTNIPSGGTSNQVLAKTSNADYQVGWTNSVTSVGLSLPGDLVVSNSPVTTAGTLTAAWATPPTGTGTIVRNTSPTLVTPVLGTPASGVATNLTGTAAGLTAGSVTTNANLTGDVTSVGNATTLTNAPVISKVLTGYSAGAGTISATDSILSAIQKNDGNVALKSPIASPTFTGTVTIPSGSSLATPTTLVGTNISGTAASLTSGHVTTNANLTGVITSVGNATSISSQTGTGTKFVTDTSPTLVTPALGTPTSGNLSNCTAMNATQLTSGTIPAARTNGHLNGTATNDDAAVSEIGEFITGTGTGNSVTSATAFNAVSISLTAGDWDVSGNIAFTFAASTTCQAVAISVSTTTATIGAISTVNSYNFGSTSTLAPNGNFTISSPVVRISVSGTTTVFLVGLSNFGTSTVSIANGASFIRARRIR